MEQYVFQFHDTYMNKIYNFSRKHINISQFDNENCPLSAAKSLNLLLLVISNTHHKTYMHAKIYLFTPSDTYMQSSGFYNTLKKALNIKDLLTCISQYDLTRI